MATTTAVVEALELFLRDAPLAGEHTSARDLVCACVTALLAAPEDPAALVRLRRACHEVAIARDAAVLGADPASGMILDAALRLGSAMEALAMHEEREARAYAGAVLEPLVEHRLQTGASADRESALAHVKSDLRARLQTNAERRDERGDGTR